MAWVDCDGYNAGLTRLLAMGLWPDDWLEIRPEENPLRLDLRCLIGLTVNVMGSDERRVAVVARACVDAGAKRVIASWHTLVYRAGEPHCETQRMTLLNEELAEWPQ
jgi:hypothetical protein